ncbi:MAG: AI-2E family transporter [Candidatus Paceibacterota bacterium]
METKTIEKYFFFGLLLAVFIFAFFIFRPFWIVLVLGACISVVLYPLYKWFIKIKLPEWLSSFLTVIFFIIIFCGPLFLISTLVFNETQNVYNYVVNSGSTIPFINSINDKIINILPHGINFDINQKISNLISFLFSNIGNIFNVTMSAIVSFILIIFSIFYFLKDGTRWQNALIRLSPISDKDDKKILNRLSQSINEIVKGYLLIALIQGILVSIGFIIFGVPNPTLWGITAGITSLLPTFGTALVTVPAIIFLFATGHLIPAIGLLIWSVIMVGMIDNLLSPIIVGKRIKIPPLLILFSVLGGIVLLGPIGVLVGPLLVSLLDTLISIYRDEFNQKTSS